MVVYEGWKAFKRNPPTSVYNPRSFGLCMLTYVTFSVATEIARPYYHGMVFDFSIIKAWMEWTSYSWL